MKKIILFWISCWSVLALLFLPFPFVFLPKVGIYLSQFIFPLNKFLCSSVGVDVSQSFLVSDSLAFYSTGFVLFFLSGILTFFLAWKSKKHFSKIQQGSFTFLILLLAYFLIRYGLDKLFEVQFYSPASNTIHTPVGQLEKDILFWTTMGTSSFYNQFMAISEILAGMLLLFNRTRFIGLVVSFGVLLNVFAINIGFDITVKYLSGLLLFTSVVCLCFYKSKLLLLIGEKSEEKIPNCSQKWMFLLFIPFVIDFGATYWNIQTKTSGESYAIDSVRGVSQFINVEEIVRIHFHPEGYLILENKQQQFTSYTLKNKETLVINNEAISIKINRNQLFWREKGVMIVWEIKQIDLNEIPLKKDKTNWYFEEIISR